MTFDELAPVIRQRRKRRRIDGRTINAVTAALEAAEQDEVKDSRIRDMVSQGKSYSAIGRELKISRQRATYLVERSYARMNMLKEFRAGRDVKTIARHWEGIYPKRTGKYGTKEVEGAPQGASEAPHQDGEAAGDQEA